MFAVALDRKSRDARECATVPRPATRTTLSDVLSSARLQVAGECQPSLSLLNTGTRSGEEAAEEQYSGRAVQYADQLGDHWW